MKSRLGIAPKLIALIASLCLIGAAGIYGIREFRHLELARVNLQVGVAELRTVAASAARPGDLTNKAAVLANESLANNAHARFALAQSLLAADPLAGWASIVPYLGVRVSSALDLAKAGLDMSAAAQRGLAVAAQVEALKPSAVGGGSPLLLRSVNLLVANRATLADVAIEIQQADMLLAKVDLGALPPQDVRPLTHLRQRLMSMSAALGVLQQASMVLPALIGEQSPQRYLVIQTDPGELRPGGGYFGSFGVLVLSHGNISLQEIAVRNFDVYTLIGQPGYYPPPPPIRQYKGPFGWDLEGSDVWPTTQQNAQQEEFFYNFERHLRGEPAQPVNGVITIDPYFIAQLVSFTGPVTLPQYGVTFTKSNFFAEVFKGTNGTGFAGHPGKAFLAPLADILLRRLLSLPLSTWPGLAQTTSTGLSQRHLQIYFNDSSAEALLRKYRVDGGFLRAGTDYIYDADSNYLTDASLFTQRHFQLVLKPNGKRLEHILTVAYSNNSPTSLPLTYFDCYFRLYLPDTAKVVSVDGITPSLRPSTEHPPHLKLISGTFQLLRGQHHVVTLVYYTNWNPGHYTLYWQKENGIDGLNVTVTFDGAHGASTLHAFMTTDRQILLESGRLHLGPSQVGSAR